MHAPSMAPPGAVTREAGAGGTREEGGANCDDEGGIINPSSTSSTSPPTSSPPTFLSRLRPPPPRVLLSEASGAVGDLGTFLPLTLGLVAAVGLDFGTTLVFTGIYNVVSGFVFGVPMPVQPMKTISAVAIASLNSSQKVTLEEVMAAGMFVSAVVLFLGVTRLVDFVNRIVPRSVVAGLQLGVGLKLASSGVKSVFLMEQQQQKGSSKRWRGATGGEGWALGAAALAFLFVSTVAARSRGEGEAGPASASSFSAPLFFPRRLQEALLKRRRRKGGGGDDDDESNSSSNSSGGSSGVSAEEPSLPLAPSSSPPPPPPAAVAPGEEPPSSTSSASWQVPSALLVTVVGVALAFATAPAAALAKLRLGPSKISAVVPSLEDWGNGITRAGGLAQLPLTTLNSVIAVSHLADSLYGGGGGGGSGSGSGGSGNGDENKSKRKIKTQKDRSRWRPSRVAIAVGLYNLLGGWFGALPACMGSGGLAAQHKFGARDGTAPILLGLFKIALALAFGSSLSSVLRFFPAGLLGAMLALAGAELAAAARAGGGGEEEEKEEGGEGGEGKDKGNAALSSPRFFAFAALTAASILGLDDPAAGFAVGWGLWVLTEAWERGVGALRGAWRRRKKEERRKASGKSQV